MLIIYSENEVHMITNSKPDQSKQACQLIYQSGPVAFAYVFNSSHGPNVLTFLNKAFQSKQTMFSHRDHFVYTDQGDVLGTIGITTKQKHNQHFIQNALWIWRFYGVRSIIKGLLFELKLVKPPKNQCLYLFHIAVDEKHRGYGIAQKLIAFAQEKAIKSKLSKLSLDVAENNHQAMRLYQHLGFKPIKRNMSYNSTLDNHIYMEKDILVKN